MNVYINKDYVRIICICLLLSGTEQPRADHCPSPDIVKQRKISRDYEWTIDERRTLDDVLAVETLYSARIKNRGEFIACYYSSEARLLRLDAKPEKNGCLIVESSGKWNIIDGVEAICEEDDIALCEYNIKCDQ